MIEIKPISAFKDNYIWLIINTETTSAIVVDPGEAQYVIEEIEKQQLTLEAIFLTHHHWDHSNGVDELIKKFNAPVYSSQLSKIPSITNRVKEQDIFSLKSLNLIFKVLEIPGHTLDHVAFYAELSIFNQPPILLTGDTLFLAGCGKVFEGTHYQMWQSLQKLKQHPLNTLIYCGHEYTESNLRFASLVEPNNLDIQNRIKVIHSIRSQCLPSVPSDLSIELKTNPFLRTDQETVIQTVCHYTKQKLNTELEVFTALREWKNKL